jgi:hypothetical protein
LFGDDALFVCDDHAAQVIFMLSKINLSHFSFLLRDTIFGSGWRRMTGLLSSSKY